MRVSSGLVASLLIPVKMGQGSCAGGRKRCLLLVMMVPAASLGMFRIDDRKEKDRFDTSI